MNNPIEPSFPFFILNGITGNRNNFPFDLLSNKSVVYEVIRVINSKPLFLHDHLQRMSNSCIKLGISCNINSINQWLADFLKNKEVAQCNLRLNIAKNDYGSEFLAYFIPSKYPTPLQYINGISLELLNVERVNPNVKIENRMLREKADEIIQQKGVYEVLLVNENGEITEGSRSNFFAVKGNAIFTAPLHQVLEGITRQKIVQLAYENGIECIEQPIRVEDLTTIDGAFITGTSPKVLPVNRIGNIAFNGVSSTTIKIIDEYNQLIRNYIEGYE